MRGEANAGEPEMPALPEPVFTLWRRADGTLMGYKKLMAEGPWLTAQEAKVYARAHGDARAKHARRVAMEEAALIVDAKEDDAREERYHPGLVGALSACAAAIRAAAPPQGEPT